MPSSSLVLRLGAVLSALSSTAFSTKYTLDDAYKGSNFLDGFDFFTAPDPTNGFVSYRDRTSAANSNLIRTIGADTYLGVDFTTPLTANGPGRASVRIESKKRYQTGLFIVDLKHMPASTCGTWPAFWSLGQGQWPTGGEIDIIEGVNRNTNNKFVLHTDTNCKVTGTGGTGTTGATDCSLATGGTAGCDVNAPAYGDTFNAGSGGVYAMEWTDKSIKMWYFPRGAIPPSITAEKPDTALFGTPTANFEGNCDFATKFVEHKFIFDTTFCGDWAGNVYGQSGCPTYPGLNSWDSCKRFVAQNPSAFSQSYWLISSFKTYKVTTVSSSSSSASSTQSSTSSSSSATSTYATTTATSSSSSSSSTASSTSSSASSSSTSSAASSTTSSASSTTSSASSTTSSASSTTSSASSTSSAASSTTSSAASTTSSAASTTSSASSTTSSDSSTTSSASSTSSDISSTISSAASTSSDISSSSSSTSSAASSTTSDVSSSTVASSGSSSTDVSSSATSVYETGSATSTAVDSQTSCTTSTTAAYETGSTTSTAVDSYETTSSSVGSYESSSTSVDTSCTTSTTPAYEVGSSTVYHSVPVYPTASFPGNYSSVPVDTYPTGYAQSSGSAQPSYVTKTYTTTYIDVCSTGYTTIHTTHTAVYEQSPASPTPQEYPAGFTTTVKYCQAGCGAYPTYVTVTVPVVKTVYPTGSVAKPTSGSEYPAVSPPSSPSYPGAGEQPHEGGKTPPAGKPSTDHNYHIGVPPEVLNNTAITATQVITVSVVPVPASEYHASPSKAAYPAGGYPSPAQPYPAPQGTAPGYPHGNPGVNATVPHATGVTGPTKSAYQPPAAQFTGAAANLKVSGVLGGLVAAGLALFL